ncbi:hypothetical protein [Microbacterium allomyrinae]|uniref:Uncharacterized protein n=1 Tax=Microbacterium allomyrinae TaxID=2830666 RepID=A0A9X1LTZ5_9MICO|nr:hypothetical protein [Microbacterium allomyrinae]MCC2031816.1 hypothetical protein [Microbacterium allomyrinae]
MPLDATLIASILTPHLDAPTTGRDLLETHLLTLEELGFLTLRPGDQSWWIVLQPAHVGPPPLTAARPPEPAWEAESSTAIEGERGRAHTRESARRRAWEQVLDEERQAEERWAGWDRREPGTPARPQRPLELQAPPLGCPDHPHGSLESCGPCGTQSDYRKWWITRERYGERLAMFKEQQPEEPDDDKPF